jgi:putative beta-lysine N-acetyltransferase
VSPVADASATAADRRTRIEGTGFVADVVVSPHNQRLQVLRYEADDVPGLVRALGERAAAEGFGKVFAKVAGEHEGRFSDAGMEPEATIRGYYSGADATVVSLFLDSARRRRPFADEQQEILDAITGRPPDPALPELPPGYRLSVAEPEDADDLAALYREVFASYPFPIMDPGYLVSTMATHVVYRLVRDAGGAVVAAASAETDAGHGNAEMTDFATLPSQRGHGLAQHLLAALEDDMAERRIDALYTIARARSAGMNRVFANRGYVWTGTLVNNCHISGRFEDMHVWCRTPRAA